MTRAEPKALNTLIVGATSSIGLSTTRAFVDAGHRVLATSRKESTRLEDPRITWSDLDLTSASSIEVFSTSAVPSFGPLDVVVVVAGILPGKQLADYEDEEMDLVMNVNFMGPARLVRSLLPQLNEEGHIILTSSVSGVRGSYDPIYAASKAGLIGFSKSLATWLGPNVRVNALAPALVQDSTMYKDMSPERREKHVQDSPGGRLATLEEIGDLVLQLVGPDWARTSGAVISIDSIPD